MTAAALEKGLDRELHTALVQEAKDNASRIGQICQDHADVFLDSVAAVAALGHPAKALSQGLLEAQQALQEDTAGPLLQASQWQAEALNSWQRAQTLWAMVQASRSTALQLETARKQAAAGRPRAALLAVEQARTQLARPMHTLLTAEQQRQAQAQQQAQAHGPRHSKSLEDSGNPTDGLVFSLPALDAKKTLLETPFGQRASVWLPKIETEVYMGARRQLNKWFLQLRSGGEGSKAGTAVLRQCSTSLAVGPGHLGLGGQVPASYVWRAKTADNLLARTHLSGKVARALRHGYWLDRDAPAEAERLAHNNHHQYEGVRRKAQAIAAAFGWYRCWDAGNTVLIDPADIVSEAESSLQARLGGGPATGAGTGGGGGSDGLAGSRHGPGGASGGGSDGGLTGSRHGLTGSSSKRSLGFRASTNSKSQAFAEISGGALGETTNNNSGSGNHTTKALSKAAAGSSSSALQWTKALFPSILYETTAANAKVEDALLLALPESVHPVRRAELAFTLLGKAEEFVQYYEQNRFGEIKVGDGKDSTSTNKTAGGGVERKSYLSSLTGDDVTVGNDRIFFVKTFPHLCASVAGFSAVEAALELGTFEHDDDTDNDDNKKTKNKGDGTADDYYSYGAAGASTTMGTATTVTGTTATGTTKSSAGGGTAGGSSSSSANSKSAMSSSLFRESSERYERALITELGTLVQSRANKASLIHLVQASHLLASLRAALKVVHPSSSARRYDRDCLTLGKDVHVTFMKLAQEEQLQATSSIVADDPKVPVLVTDLFASKRGGGLGFLASNPTPNPSTTTTNSSGGVGVPEPEEMGLPFGLHHMKQRPPETTPDGKSTSSKTTRRSLPVDDAYTFSSSVPTVLRLIHARAIATATFALNQLDMGQAFPEKSNGGSDAAGFVLDCVEECINVAAVGMKDSDHTVDEGSVEKAVQVMANITALQHTLPRVFATLIRGMTHIGLIPAQELEETVAYAERTLKAADKACDAQIGSTYSLVYEICRTRMDSHVTFALENFNWVAKSIREKPNAYTEGLIGYLRSVFNSLGPMDEGSRAGLHFSCCGHVSERLVQLFSGKVGDTASMDTSGITPITRIDAFGIKNLQTDCGELEKFADSTGIPQLRDCFSELRTLTTFLLDKELPVLVQPDQVQARRRKYPILSLEKVGNVLEKYVGTGLGDKLLMGGDRSGARAADLLMIDKKELPALIKVVRAQQFS